MFLVEQFSNTERGYYGIGGHASVIDLDDLVMEDVNDATLLKAFRQGFDFVNLYQNANIFIESKLEEYIIRTDDLFCLWTSGKVEFALNEDYYGQIYIHGRDVYCNNDIVYRYVDYIGFPYRMRTEGNIEINLYSGGKFEGSIILKDVVKYQKGARNILQKKVLLGRK